MKKLKLLFSQFALVVLMGLLPSEVSAQGIQLSGHVVDDNNEPVIGATVTVKGHPSMGTISDMDGIFKLKVPSEQSEITISSVGLKSQTIRVGKKRKFDVTLVAETSDLNEIVVVGYGQQKKASIVGAITQTDAKTLERYAALPSLGQALTGNLPGVITSVGSGMPGDEDPKIIIRTATSWNNQDPYILVDGVERPMSAIDISSVESISVLKDASATAVYGVKGANGVILITTKRGKEGKASVHVKGNATVKLISKLPEKYDSYNTFCLLNNVVERELAVSPNAWGSYKPMEIINKYRNPANMDEWDRYPNVDWQSELFRDYTMSYNAGADVSGGTRFVKYFAAVDFTHEGDMFKKFTNRRGYQSGFGFNRVNMRANLDFDITKTTKFSTNLFGSNGVRSFPYGQGDDANPYWASVYFSAPDAMRPVYSDGTYGWYAPRNADVPNSAADLATSGSESRTKTQITTDFILNQKLDFLTKGLNFQAKLSFDNTMVENKRGINDQYNYSQRKWINPDTGDISYQQSPDFVETVDWTTQGGNVDKGQTYRKLYYMLQLDYSRKFGDHEIAGLGVFSREKWSKGNEFSHYREDWVFRATYNYATRYFAEVNGAYNGSEKFGPKKRFDFFPSFSAGWMLSNEPFMKSTSKWLDQFKFRFSWGRVGDDCGLWNSNRFLNDDQYAYGGTTKMGTVPADTPYTIYKQTLIGNPLIGWEISTKRNYGIDYSFLSGMVSGSLDIFNETRRDIMISGGSRAIPGYFGFDAPNANLGKTKSHGYEFVIRLNKKWGADWRTWLNFNITHAKNKISFRDDPELLASYRKQQGYAINQVRSYIDKGYIASWDDLYGSSERQTNNGNKLVGDYQIADFNGDGIINDDDQAPYQYSDVPQNTYSTTIGAEWKGLSLTIQFYGVSNVTRQIVFPTFQREGHVAFNEGSYWTPETQSGIPYPRWTTTTDASANGTRNFYDGSFLRLKNVELSYTFSGSWVKRLKLNQFRIYANGDNLILWTKMPDDREINVGGNPQSGAYPTVRRINLGLDLTF